MDASVVTSRFGFRPGRCRGVTLVELVVVIGLLAVVMAILLPVIRYARLVAADAVCTSRLRDLSMASLMYRIDYGQFPSPCRYTVDGDTRAVAVPHNVNTRLINNIGRYLKVATVGPMTPVTQLPHHVQSPWAERTRNGRGPKSPKKLDPETNDFYYTGYIYTADLDLALAGSQLLSLDGIGALLDPQRSASSRRAGRGVVWADDLHRNLPDAYWRFGHGPSSGAGAEPFTYREVRSLRGQHRGYSDGSVEWIGAAELGLRLGEEESDLDLLTLLEQLKAKAAYHVGDTLWWF